MKIIRPASILDAQLVSSNVPETDYSAWASGTTYALGARVRVVSTNVHLVFESLVASNLGNDPLTSPTKWIQVGATNRWAMFDGSIGNQTTNPTSIAVTLAVAGRCDSVALLNVSAVSARIVMTDVATSSVVYDKTFSLTSTSGVADWFAYYFEPIERRSDLVVSDLPPYANTTIAITLSYPGGTAACGECVVGFSKSIGATQYGASLGIQDYSRKQKDAYGNTDVLERAFAKRGTFRVMIASSYVDQLQTLLAGYRATPILYIGSERFASLSIYGFYKDFSVDVSYRDRAVCSIEIEGLT